jgi:hypothetical protein
LVVEFFCRVQDMAEERLVLAEINKPEGRTLLDPGRDVELNDRWCLMWGGKCIVQSVLHILDPFREYREICDWFGRRFCFLGNSLMLPFNLHESLDELNMRQHVTDQLRTKPFLHFGFERQKSNWQFEKFLVQFRRKFLDYSEDNQSFNWPDTPILNPVSDDNTVLRLYTAILVIYCRCSASVKRTFEYEKKFVAIASTKRGKDLMFGNDGVKEEKFLNIPPGLLKFLEDPTFKRTLKQTKPVEEAPKKEPKPKKLKPIKLIDVLLIADVEGVGKKNKIVKVNEDYAKMYLIPRKLAEIPRKERAVTPTDGAKSGRGKTPSPQKSRPGTGKPNTSQTERSSSSPKVSRQQVISSTGPTADAASNEKDSTNPNVQNSDINKEVVENSASEDKKVKAKAKKLKAMSKATIAEEIQSSRNVTRLPPMTGSSSMKMTRRLDEGRPPTPNAKK